MLTESALTSGVVVKALKEQEDETLSFSCSRPPAWLMVPVLSVTEITRWPLVTINSFQPAKSGRKLEEIKIGVDSSPPRHPPSTE